MPHDRTLEELIIHMASDGIAQRNVCFYVDPDAPYRHDVRDDARIAVGSMSPGNHGPFHATLLTLYADRKEIAEVKLDYEAAVLMGLKLLALARIQRLWDHAGGIGTRTEAQPNEPLWEFVRRVAQALPEIPEPEPGMSRPPLSDQE